MIGFRFSEFIASAAFQDLFGMLLNVFMQLLNITSGNVAEALSIMSDLDRKYNLTDDAYGLGDFIQNLKDMGYIAEKSNNDNTLTMTVKSEREIRKRSLDEIFSKIKKDQSGNHPAPYSGEGDEKTADRRNYRFGDQIDQIDSTSSIKNAQINHGINDFNLTEEDLEIEERDYNSAFSTVLMIDISHSMILYGEDRISPAKKVAMALSELITRKYPKDGLDIIVFGDEAWPVTIKDLPYLKAGPYHTNTVAGIDLAINILRKKKTKNKQIFMITDGKPTCLKIGIKYYKNSFGLDRKIVNRTLDQAARCRKLGILVTTFMIASDPYLKEFVRDFTKINRGRAYYSTLSNLGEFMFEDFVRNRKKKVR